MNDVVTSAPVLSHPYLLRNTQTLLPLGPCSSHNTMAGRKRKADNDSEVASFDRMSSSPSPTPASLRRASPTSSNRTTKRARTSVSGRPLALPRLLETLSADEMRSVLRSICDRHPEIGSEIVNTAPRPSVTSAIGVLHSYESALRASFPYGDRPSSEYSYNRVRQSLMNLIEALKDYTPHFLPPNEQQITQSLAYLDEATEIIHQLPNWDSYQHDRHKQEAYEEIAEAWVHVIREASKKGGGIQLQLGKWDQKVAKHNELSNGKMQSVVNELRSSLGWIGHGSSNSNNEDNQPSIRQQLSSGVYGLNVPVEVRW